MQALRHSEDLSEIEIRQEARFVLWAFRCSLLEHGRNSRESQAEIVRGFELADVLETLPTFQELARVFQAAAPGVVWHGPACACISAGEMQTLHALAQVADHLRGGVTIPSHWWRILVPVGQVLPLDQLARRWLVELNRAGIEYPGATRLIEALTPLQMLVGDAPSRRAVMN